MDVQISTGVTPIALLRYMQLGTVLIGETSFSVGSGRSTKRNGENQRCLRNKGLDLLESLLAPAMEQSCCQLLWHMAPAIVWLSALGNLLMNFRTENKPEKGLV